MEMFNIEALRAAGIYFGYPHCCIDWFAERAEKIKEASDFDGTLNDNQKEFYNGFIPCPVCAAKVKPGEEGALISNRLSPNPFPVDK